MRLYRGNTVSLDRYSKAVIRSIVCYRNIRISIGEIQRIIRTMNIDILLEKARISDSRFNRTKWFFTNGFGTEKTRCNSKPFGIMSRKVVRWIRIFSFMFLLQWIMELNYLKIVYQSLYSYFFLIIVVAVSSLIPNLFFVPSSIFVINE